MARLVELVILRASVRLAPVFHKFAGRYRGLCRHPEKAAANDRLRVVCHFAQYLSGGLQLIGQANRLSGEQAHFLEIARNFRRRRNSGKPLHRETLAEDRRLTNDRKVVSRCNLVWWRVVAAFPFPHQAIAQPTGRRIGKFRTEYETSRRFIDLGGENASLVFLVRISLGACQKARSDPHRLGPERQCCSHAPPSAIPPAAMTGVVPA